MRLFVFGGADPERVFERVERNVVAVVGVVIILVGVGRLGGFKNNLEIAFDGPDRSHVARPTSLMPADNEASRRPSSSDCCRVQKKSPSDS